MADISSISALNLYPKYQIGDKKGASSGLGGAKPKVGGYIPQENFQAKSAGANPFGVGAYSDGSLNGGGYGLAFGPESTGVHGNSEAVGKKLQLVG